MKGEEQPLCSGSKVVIPQPGLNLTGATTPFSPSSYIKKKNQKENDKKGKKNLNAYSKFRVSFPIVFRK